MTAAPAVAAIPPRPFGELGQAPVETLEELAARTWQGAYSTRMQRGMATRNVLNYLQRFPGETWQQRWEASDVGRGQAYINDLGLSAVEGVKPSTGVRSLVCLRAIRPSMLSLRRHMLLNFGPMFVQAQSDAALSALAEQIPRHCRTHRQQTDTLVDLCALLAVQDVALADVTGPALLHHVHESRQALAQITPGSKRSNRLHGASVWQLLYVTGHLPANLPDTMRAALMRGQRTVPELVDRYPIRNAPVRELLIDYLQRRSASVDYSTIKSLAADLAHHFWEKIESINPEQADLRIDQEVYEAWRALLKVKDGGGERIGQESKLIVVRSFYYDLHTWAAQEPERWGPWVAPCPIPPAELRGLGAKRRRNNERSANRTRVRQPLLPTLVEHVETRYERARALLELAEKTALDEHFEYDGERYSRVLSSTDRRLLRHAATAPIPTRILERSSGRMIHIATEEESAFWDWVIVEVLRHSGVRIEELCELNHLSIRQYRRRNGEVIPLLVVAPSKTDRERVIPMSVELFHAIASIVRRHTRDGRTIPLQRRYDHHEKVWSEPMPFLFQRQRSAGHGVFSSAAILQRLKARCLELAEHHPEFRGLDFTPHDFRRIFATELVNSGLPIHIGAALLGHLSIETTRGYVAVFDEDVINHYQQHLHARRTVRPAEEYRDATPEEWTEFEEHFDLRKVELGGCQRPYGTPCQHEHACVRCPMLQVDPKMIPRLDEMEIDLLARRERAEAEGWRGEIEGIDMTLSYLRDKRDQAQRHARKVPIALAMPTIPPRG